VAERFSGLAEGMRIRKMLLKSPGIRNRETR
jgi:hypothetical protein